MYSEDDLLHCWLFGWLGPLVVMKFETINHVKKKLWETPAVRAVLLCHKNSLFQNILCQ